MKKLFFVVALCCVATFSLTAQQGLAEAIAQKISQNFVIEAQHLPQDKDGLVMDALDQSVIDSVILLLEEKGFEVKNGWLDDVYAHNCAFKRSRITIISLSRNSVALYAAVIEREEDFYQNTLYIDVRYCEYRLMEKFGIFKSRLVF